MEKIFISRNNQIKSSFLILIQSCLENYRKSTLYVLQNSFNLKIAIPALQKLKLKAFDLKG